MAACGSASVSELRFHAHELLAEIRGLDGVGVLGGESMVLLAEVAIEATGDIRAALGPAPGDLGLETVHLTGNGGGGAMLGYPAHLLLHPFHVGAHVLIHGRLLGALPSRVEPVQGSVPERRSQ
jgi:hypothetical protein